MSRIRRYESKIKGWHITEVAAEVEALVTGWIENIEPLVDGEVYYYHLTGIATHRPDFFEEGEEIQIRVYKNPCKEGHKIEGRGPGSRAWFLLNYIA